MLSAHPELAQVGSHLVDVLRGARQRPVLCPVRRLVVCCCVVEERTILKVDAILIAALARPEDVALLVERSSRIGSPQLLGVELLLERRVSLNILRQKLDRHRHWASRPASVGPSGVLRDRPRRCTLVITIRARARGGTAVRRRVAARRDESEASWHDTIHGIHGRTAAVQNTSALLKMHKYGRVLYVLHRATPPSAHRRCRLRPVTSCCWTDGAQRTTARTAAALLASGRVRDGQRAGSNTTVRSALLSSFAPPVACRRAAAADLSQ